MKKSKNINRRDMDDLFKKMEKMHVDGLELEHMAKRLKVNTGSPFKRGR
jgi:hypothetical protein